MANLIVPNPQQHKYIVGIDFGHGETSAAICEIDWGSQIGLSNVSVTDVSINPANTGNEKVIVSAISQIPDEKPQIGENAFGAEQLQDKASIRVCFKEPPHSINGEAETLMTTFMKAVYEQIRSISSKLTDDNHIVYIARPSGWQDEKTKELYMQMALRAGLPLGGLTSESRAAIFYALNDPKIAFKNEILEGAIVFDLGSSTLDFTYIAKDHKPIDYGYPHGASLIDKVIFDDKMASCEGVKRLLASHPQYEPALLFQARKQKEDFYKKTSKKAAIDIGFQLRNIISHDCPDYDELKNELVIIEYENLDAFNDTLEKQIGYKTKIREDLADFKNNHIAGKEIKGVFLTGGASRMGFISEIIREEYGLSPDAVKVDPDNPSLTISRGIAMLGRADAMSSVFQEKLMAKVQAVDCAPFVNSFKLEFTNELTNWYWKKMEAVILDFARSKTNLTLNDLNNSLDKAVMDTSDIVSVQEKVLKECAKNHFGVIKDELNAIISIYWPGYEIQDSTIENISIKLDAVSTNIADSMDSVVEEVKDVISITTAEVIGDILLSILMIFTPLGPFIALIVIGKKVADWFKSSDEKARKLKEELMKPRSQKERTSACQQFLSDEAKICTKIRKPISYAMNKLDAETVKSLRDIFKAYLNNVIQENIDNVKIEIE